MDVFGSRFCSWRRTLSGAACALALCFGAPTAAAGETLPILDCASVARVAATGRELGVSARCVIPIARSDANQALSVSPSFELDALPPPPNSIVMGIGALGCLGAVQLTRSIRRLAWTHLPDWYHTGAPSRIGHIRLFEFGAVCVEPVFGSVPWGAVRIERPLLDERVITGPPLIPTRTPRSPPAVAPCA